MKKTIITWAALTALISACGSGGNGRTAQTGGLTFDSIVTDTTVALTQAKDAPTCHLRLSIQYAKGKTGDAVNDSILHAGIFTPDYFAIGNGHISMQHAVDSFVSRYIEDYKREFGDFYRQDPEHAATYNNEYLVGTTTRNGRDGIIIYMADIYLYAGGAHGSAQTIVKNIDAKTGSIMKLSDLFVPGYETGLGEHIVKKLCEKFDVKNIEQLREQHAIFEGIDVYVTDNFIMDKKQLTFIYVEDEIAPHAVGEIRIDLPYTELEDLLKQ